MQTCSMQWIKWPSAQFLANWSHQFCDRNGKYDIYSQFQKGHLFYISSISIPYVGSPLQFPAQTVLWQLDVVCLNLFWHYWEIFERIKVLKKIHWNKLFQVNSFLHWALDIIAQRRRGKLLVQFYLDLVRVNVVTYDIGHLWVHKT